MTSLAVVEVSQLPIQPIVRPIPAKAGKVVQVVAPINQGPPGERGSGYITGQRAPTAADGQDGDYWIDASTTPRLIYGPKAGGAWPAEGEPFATDLTPEIVAARNAAVSAKDAAVGLRDQASAAADRAEGASALAAAKAGQFATLSALRAIPSPSVIAAAEVVADGANNGTYQYDPANASAGWVKKSSATVPALDARTNFIDASFLSTEGDLAHFTDAMKRLVLLITEKGHARGVFEDFTGAPYLRDAELGLERVANVDGDFWIWRDALGRVMLVLAGTGHLQGRFETLDGIPYATQADIPAGLADRLNRGLTAYGLVRDEEVYGRALLRETHKRLAVLDRFGGLLRAVADHVGSYASYPAAARQLRQAFGVRVSKADRIASFRSGSVRAAALRR